MIDKTYITKTIDEISVLPDDADKQAIDQTLRELEGHNYSPILTIDVPGFLTSTKTDIIRFLTSITEEQMLSLNPEDLSLIVYHFKLLQRLRRNEPESWDYIMELMEDD